MVGVVVQRIMRPQKSLFLERNQLENYVGIFGWVITKKRFLAYNKKFILTIFIKNEHGMTKQNIKYI